MTERRCNECTLCCKLLPVAEINKPASTKCPQQRASGCRIYKARGYPRGCSLWSCLWLSDESVSLPRPDRAGYVLDPTPEFIEVEGYTVSVVQIWVDPRRPNVHRDPALRAWLAARWQTHEQLALVRFDAAAALTLFPPGVVVSGWYEQAGKATTEHSAQQVVETLRALKR